MSRRSYITLEQIMGLPAAASSALMRNFQRLSHHALNAYTIPLSENLGPTNPLTLPFYLPPETEILFSVRLHFKLENFRSPATGSAGGGSTTVTSGNPSAENSGIPSSSDPSSHVHSISHTHQVDIAAHTHILTYGIYEGTAPTDVTVTVDGIDRTVALGGPFNEDQADLDLTEFISGTGWHEIELGTTQLGRLVAAVFVEALVRLP